MRERAALRTLRAADAGGRATMLQRHAAAMRCWRSGMVRFSRTLRAQHEARQRAARGTACYAQTARYAAQTRRKSHFQRATDDEVLPFDTRLLSGMRAASATFMNMSRPNAVPESPFHQISHVPPAAAKENDVARYFSAKVLRLPITREH